MRHGNKGSYFMDKSDWITLEEIAAREQARKRVVQKLSSAEEQVEREPVKNNSSEVLEKMEEICNEVDVEEKPPITLSDLRPGMRVRLKSLEEIENEGYSVEGQISIKGMSLTINKYMILELGDTYICGNIITENNIEIDGSRFVWPIAAIAEILPDQDDKCLNCQGTGYLFFYREGKTEKLPCPTCNGTGKVQQEEKLTLQPLSRIIFAENDGPEIKEWVQRKLFSMAYEWGPYGKTIAEETKCDGFMQIIIHDNEYLGWCGLCEDKTCSSHGGCRVESYSTIPAREFLE